VGQIDVMADEVALHEPALGEEDLVEIRDLNVVAADPHGAEGTGPANHPSRGRQAVCPGAIWVCRLPSHTRRLVTASRTVRLCGSYNTVRGASPFLGSRWFWHALVGLRAWPGGDSLGLVFWLRFLARQARA